MEQWKTYVAAVGDDVRGRLGDLAATGTFVAVLTPMDFTVWDTGSAAGWVGLYGAGAVAEAERRRGTPMPSRSSGAAWLHCPIWRGFRCRRRR